MKENNLHSKETSKPCLGDLYFEQMKYELALDEFNKSLESNPFDEVVLIKIGHVHLRKKEISVAVSIFNKVSELNPGNSEAHLGLGFCLFEKNETKKAEEKFNFVLSIDPDKEYAHFGLGLCYHERSEFKKSSEEFAKVLDLNPNNVLARYHLNQEIGNILYEEKDYQGAINRYQQVLNLCLEAKITSNDSVINEEHILETHLKIAMAYSSIGNYSLALMSINKALNISSKNPQALGLLSKIHMQLGDYETAVDVFLKNYTSFSTNNKEFLTKEDIQRMQGFNNIKILRIPNFYGLNILSTEMNSIMLPPLALGNIVSYLRNRGIRIDQDDLHIKIHSDNYSSGVSEMVNEKVFFDTPRIMEYVKGKTDPEIDSIMNVVYSKTMLEGYQVILFSLDSCSMNFTHATFALCLAKYLKGKHNPIIILGGLAYFPEFMKNNNCDWPDIDYVICREGEVVVFDLLVSLLKRNLKQDKNEKKDDSKVLYADKVPMPVKPDFTGLPLCKYKYQGINSDYCKAQDLKKIINKFNLSETFLLPFRFIKGCTNRCVFCASSFGGLIHVIEPKTVATWLYELQVEYHPTGYLFLNDTLNISRKYLIQLCDEIIKKKSNILWSDCVRADRLDRDSILKMREAGCIRMVFGMETASKKLLNYIKKDINLEHLEKTLLWANEAGIWTGVELISGLPYENKNDIQETISFIQNNRMHIDTLYYNAFNLKETSLLNVNPKDFGLENIFELSNYEDGFQTFVQYGFDEINGLKWKDKRKQIIESLNRVVQEFGEMPFPEHEYEHFLFFLFSNCKDKKEIKKIFYLVGKEKMKYLNKLRRKNMTHWHTKQDLNRTLIYG